MANTQSFHDWQGADAAAEAAQHSLSTAIRRGQQPTPAQFDEIVRLREQASELLRAMVEDI